MGEWTEYTKLFAGLIAIVNPLGAVPVYLSLTASLSMPDKKRTAIVAALSVAAILIFFTVAGTAFLSFFGITLDAFRVAGGLLLLLMALHVMGAGDRGGGQESSGDTESIGIVPLAIPLMGGPGAISAVILYSGQSESVQHKLLVMSVVLGVSAVVYVALRAGLVGSKMISAVAVRVFNKIMGLIIAAISVELILDGIAGHFPGLL